MTILGDYRRESKLRPNAAPEYQTREALDNAGRHLSEIPTRIGLSLIGSRLLSGIVIISLLLFVGLVFNQPVFDYRVDARLSDHYSRVVDAIDDVLGLPEMADKIDVARFTDLEQTDDRIFVATYGHGIQSYDRENYLWKSFDARSTGFEIDNDIEDIHYQTLDDKERLWTAGLDGEISIGEFSGRGDVSFKSLYGRAAWHFLRQEEITVTNMIDADHVVFGTASKGAGVYNLRKHSWQDLTEVSGLHIRKVQYLSDQRQLWLLTDKGISAFVAVPGATANESTFEHLPASELHSEDLTGMKVFADNTVIGLTSDQGSYLFHEQWSEKLLGGPEIAGLSQDAIEHTVHWNNWIVVLGSEFGVAAYDTKLRTWRSLVSGDSVPQITDFDYDENRLLIATVNGVIVVDRDHSVHILPNTAVERISLGLDGFLFVVAGGDSKQLMARWSNFGGDIQYLMVGDSKLNITKPKIFDVAVMGNRSYWLATDQGVIRYQVRERALQLLNDSNGKPIRNARKLFVVGERVYLLGVGGVYSWSEANAPIEGVDGSGSWQLSIPQATDMVLDQGLGDLWVRFAGANSRLVKYNAKSLEDVETWFEGQGPKSLNLRSTPGVVETTATGGFRAYFPVPKENRLYTYNSARAIWEQPRELPTHRFDRFTILGDNSMLSIRSDDRTIYQDNKLLMGGGDVSWSLGDTLHGVKSEGKLALYGPDRTSIYDPAFGSWTNQPRYDFLGSNTHVAEVVSDNFHGRFLLRGSGDQLWTVDRTWKKAEYLGGVDSDQFDGRSFWSLSNHALLQTEIVASADDNGFETKRSKYFADKAPDFTRLLEARHDSKQNQLNFVLPSRLATYDFATHNWNEKSLPGKPLLESKIIAGVIEGVTETDLVSIKLNNLNITSHALPQGKLLKLDRVGTRRIVTMVKKGRYEPYRRIENGWQSLSIERHGYKGDFNQIQSLFALEQQVLTIAADGLVGRYHAGEWDTYQLPANFRLDGFQRVEGRLLAVGRTGKGRLVMPRYYFNKSGFHSLSPAPTDGEEFGIEASRFLWVRSRSRGLEIYDLANPKVAAINLRKVVEKTESNIGGQMLFDFDQSSYTFLPIKFDADEWRRTLNTDAVTGLGVNRDGTNLRLIFNEGDRISIVQRRANRWYLESLFSSTSESVVQAQRRLNGVNQLKDPVKFEMTSTDARLLFRYDPGQEVLQAAAGTLKSTRFADLGSKMKLISQQREVRINGLRLTISDSGLEFFTEGGQPIPVSNGRVESDTALLDATVKGGGWWALRRKSLVQYSDSRLLGVENYGQFEKPVSSKAYLMHREGRLLLHDAGKVMEVGIRVGMVEKIPYELKRTVYQSKETGLAVVQTFDDTRVLLDDKSFKGLARFPFDRVQKMSADSSGVYLFTGDGMFRQIKTNDGVLKTLRREPVDKNLAKGEFTNCSDRSVRVVRKGKHYDVVAGFPTLDPDTCIRPETLFTHGPWRWRLNREVRIITFETIQEGNWSAVDRLDKDHFQDDRYVWLTEFNGQVFAATALGVRQIEPGGQSHLVYIPGGVSKIKQHAGRLFALSKGGRVLEWVGKREWHSGDTVPGDIFGKYTTRVQDAFIRLKHKDGHLRFETVTGRKITWDKKARDFAHNRFSDYRVKNGRLFVVNEQTDRIVSYGVNGTRSRYFNKLGKVNQLRTTDGGDLLAVMSASLYQLIDGTWKEYRAAYRPVARIGALGFREKFGRAAGKGLVPAIGDVEIPDYWANGRFTFDQIRNLTAMPGGRWWAATAAGLLQFGNGASAPAMRLKDKEKRIEHLANRGKQLIVAGENIRKSERALDTVTGRLVKRDLPLFTRQVFDFLPHQNGYRWIPLEVPLASKRTPFIIELQGKKRIDEVFAGHRFFWDQIHSAALDIDNARFWLTIARHLTVNRIGVSEQKGPTLKLEDIVSAGAGAKKSVLADAEFAGKTLYGLFVPESSDEENDSPKREWLRKRVDGKWVEAGNNEYPFWQPTVKFTLPPIEWRPDRMTFSAWRNGEPTFRPNLPDGYPLFTPLDYAPAFGKFSFDYVSAVTTSPPGPRTSYSDPIWAATRGGLIKLGYIEDESRLAIEKLVLPEDGLFENSILGLKLDAGFGQTHARVQALQAGSQGAPSVQHVQIPMWQQLESIPEPLDESIPLSHGARFVVAQNLAESTGSLDLITADGKRFSLMRLRRASHPDLYLRVDASPEDTAGDSYLHQGDAVYQFNLDAVSPLERNRLALTPVEPGVSNEKRGSPAFSTKFGSTGLSFGRDGLGRYALHTPEGRGLVIAGLGEDLIRLELRADRFVWVQRDGKVSVEYNYSQVDGSLVAQLLGDHDSNWQEYLCPPGMSISQYLLDFKIVERQNFFRRLVGAENTELEKWVDIIARRNQLKSQGSGKLDYYLEVGKLYQMPLSRDAEGTQNERLAASMQVEDQVIELESGDTTNPALRYSGKIISHIDSHLLEFDLENLQVEMIPLPVDGPVHGLYSASKGDAVFVFQSVGEELVGWGFWPHYLGGETLDLAAYNSIEVTSWGKTLSAAEVGIEVRDDVEGHRLAQVNVSSEWFFGTRLGKVVSIQSDRLHNGFWIATQTNGLVWTGNPF
ncbi:hypothetical protein N8198_02730 [Gammaproteobacteria bacterium]|nr:hypothetical protein [Gammaproteobacteria bacterium]